MKKLIIVLIILFSSILTVSANCKNNSIAIEEYPNYKYKVDNIFKKLVLKSNSQQKKYYIQLKIVTLNYFKKNDFHINNKMYTIIEYISCQNKEKLQPSIQSYSIPNKVVKQFQYGHVSKKEYDEFPKYKNIVTEKIKTRYKVLMPRNSNGTNIYMNDKNKGHYIISEPSFKLEGTVRSDIQKIEVIWDGDMQSYFLKKYNRLTPTFSYNISQKYGVLKEGKNRYLIRGYAEDIIYERIIVVNYVNYDNVKQIKYSKEDYSYDSNYIEKPLYKILEDTTKYREYGLLIDSGVSLFQTQKYDITMRNTVDNSYGEYNKNQITIFNKQGQKLSSIKDMNFTADAMSLPKIKISKNTGDIIFSKSGHESPLDYRIYHKKSGNIYKVFDLIKKYAPIKNYFVNVTLNAGILEMKSLWTPWGETTDEYILKIELDTGKLLSIKTYTPKITKDYGRGVIIKATPFTQHLYINGNHRGSFDIIGENKLTQLEVGKSGVYVLSHYSGTEKSTLAIHLFNGKGTYWNSKTEGKINKMELLVNKKIKLFFLNGSTEILDINTL